MESAAAPDISPDSASRRSASAEAVSLHTASFFQRSIRTRRRSGTARTHADTPRASAPASFAIPDRFQFIVIVFCLPRFPAFVPVASSLRGSVPGAASPNRSRGSLTRFKSVKIVFSQRLRSGRFRDFRRSVRRPLRHLRPAMPGFRLARIEFGWPVVPPSVFRFTTRIRPPVRFVCRSVQSWFVSPVRFLFNSVRFQFSFGSFSVCSKFNFGSVCIRFGLVLSLFCALCPLTGDLFILSRVYYTLYRPFFKCIFYQKTCAF